MQRHHQIPSHLAHLYPQQHPSQVQPVYQQHPHYPNAQNPHYNPHAPSQHMPMHPPQHRHPQNGWGQPATTEPNVLGYGTETTQMPVYPHQQQMPMQHPPQNGWGQPSPHYSQPTNHHETTMQNVKIPSIENYYPQQLNNNDPTQKAVYQTLVQNLTPKNFLAVEFAHLWVDGSVNEYISDIPQIVSKVQNSEHLQNLPNEFKVAAILVSKFMLGLTEHVYNRILYKHKSMKQNVVKESDNYISDKNTAEGFLTSFGINLLQTTQSNPMTDDTLTMAASPVSISETLTHLPDEDEVPVVNIPDKLPTTPSILEASFLHPCYDASQVYTVGSPDIGVVSDLDEYLGDEKIEFDEVVLTVNHLPELMTEPGLIDIIFSENYFSVDPVRDGELLDTLSEVKNLDGMVKCLQESDNTGLVLVLDQWLARRINYELSPAVEVKYTLTNAREDYVAFKEHISNVMSTTKSNQLNTVITNASARLVSSFKESVLKEDNLIKLCSPIRRSVMLPYEFSQLGLGDSILNKEGLIKFNATHPLYDKLYWLLSTDKEIDYQIVLPDLILSMKIITGKRIQLTPFRYREI